MALSIIDIQCLCQVSLCWVSLMVSELGFSLKDTQHNDTQYNGTQHNWYSMLMSSMSSFVMLSILDAECLGTIDDWFWSNLILGTFLPTRVKLNHSIFSSTRLKYTHTWGDLRPPRAWDLLRHGSLKDTQHNDTQCNGTQHNQYPMLMSSVVMLSVLNAERLWVKS